LAGLFARACRPKVIPRLSTAIARLLPIVALFKGHNQSRARDGSRRARLVLRRWRCVGHSTPYSAGRAHQSSASRRKPRTHPEGRPELRTLFVPNRTRLGMLTTRTQAARTHLSLSRPNLEALSTVFGTAPLRGHLLPVLGFRSMPPDRVSPTGLRPLSGSADPPVPPRPFRAMPECRRPTAFTAPPLLAGNVPGHYPTLGGVYARLRPTFSPVIADPSRPPTHLHASIREGCSDTCALHLPSSLTRWLGGSGRQPRFRPSALWSCTTFAGQVREGILTPSFG
jgi:hypothetical protein